MMDKEENKRLQAIQKENLRTARKEAKKLGLKVKTNSSETGDRYYVWDKNDCIHEAWDLHGSYCFLKGYAKALEEKVEE